MFQNIGYPPGIRQAPPTKPDLHIKTIYGTTVAADPAGECQVKAATTSENATLDGFKPVIIVQTLWLTVS